MHCLDDVDGERRRRADEEDDDDCERDVREVLLLALFHLQGAPHAPAAAQREDELRVEEYEEGEWEEEEEEGVERAGVEVAVDRAVAERRLCAQVRAKVLVLEIARDVEQDWDAEDRDDDAAHLRHGAQRRHLQGKADGDVALDRDEHRQPHSGHLRHHENRPEDELDIAATVV